MLIFGTTSMGSCEIVLNGLDVDVRIGLSTHIIDDGSYNAKRKKDPQTRSVCGSFDQRITRLNRVVDPFPRLITSPVGTHDAANPAILVSVCSLRLRVVIRSRICRVSSRACSRGQ